MAEELLVTCDHQIGTITFNREEKRNSLTTDMLVELASVLDAWARDDQVRVVVFRGRGNRAFSSGYDISAIPTHVDEGVLKAMKGRNPVENVLQQVARYPYPTIAMMNGYAFGAGLNLAVCCDIRIASDSIRVGMPPAKLGLVYHPEGLKQFIDVVGLPRAKELFFSGRTYCGEAVREMGLADHLVSSEDLEPYVYTLASEISANAPIALKGMKSIFSMIANAAVLNDSDMVEAETLIMESFNSRDLKEGQAAFLEKRKPEFVGK